MLSLFHEDGRDEHFRSDNKLFRLLQPLICRKTAETWPQRYT